MNDQLEAIFRTKEFQSTDNKMVKIVGETPRYQCEFLQSLIQDNNYKKSLEIGLAYGMSAVATTEVVLNNGGSNFVIDAFDDIDFESVKKLLRYISQFPSYDVHDQIPKNRTPTIKRKIFESLRNLPKAKRYIQEELLVSTNELKINSQYIALLKKTDDKRSTLWYVDFNSNKPLYIKGKSPKISCT